MAKQKKKNNTKKKKNSDIPQGFTVGLAAADIIPVAFFGIDMILAGLLFASRIFIFGALLCLFAGIAKVIWKFLIAKKKKDIQWLSLQMRILMPAGLTAMTAGLIISRKKIAFDVISKAVMSFPTVIFFIIGLLCMLAMAVMMFALDNKKRKSNVIEQTVNSIAQISFFIGLLMII